MKKKILVIDDEPNIRRLLGFNLKEKFDVDLAENGDEALNFLLKDAAPDLIISDVTMPKLDGYQFIETVKQHGRLKNIPVIFLTAKSQSIDRIKGLKLGAIDYIVKPFNPEEIVIRVENILMASAPTVN